MAGVKVQVVGPKRNVERQHFTFAFAKYARNPF